MPNNIFIQTTKKTLLNTGGDYVWTPSGASGSAWQSPAIDCLAVTGVLYPQFILNLSFKLAATGTANAAIEVYAAWSDSSTTGYPAVSITGTGGTWAPAPTVAVSKLQLDLLGGWVNPANIATSQGQLFAPTNIKKRYLVIVLVNSTSASHGGTAADQFGDITFINPQVQ
jgi:hypothetical protein